MRVSSLSIVIAATLATPSSSYASDVVAVMSSRLEPYQEALNGFEKAFGAEVPALDLGDSRGGIKQTTKVVVAFGSRAAAQLYPAHALLVYCMAPGVRLSKVSGGKQSIRISMTPPASTILRKIKILQPRLHRLGFLWISDNQEAFNQEMLAAAHKTGIELLSHRLSNTDELPDQLRVLHAQHAEALWVPPDPQLLTPDNFNVMRTFSRSSRIPFYVANEGFVEKGATAAIAISFQEIGRSAARVARKILEGNFDGTEAYPDKVVLVVSEQAAAETGLDLTAEARQQVDKVMP